MIPKILHFCFGMTRNFGGKPWSLLHHACIRSAVEQIKPTEAFFYCEYEPQGAWWRLTRELVTIVKIKAPRAIFGNPLPHPAHRADVFRLEKLLEMGGIYLDSDVFVHRDFDDLLHYSTVLGQEGKRGRFGLCNAVILAEAEAPFLKRWYAEYASFRSKGHDSFWSEHSVIIPSRLANEFPEEITILPDTAFFWPTWEKEGLKRIFGSVDPIIGPGVYANHLWERLAWDLYLEHLTPKRVRSFDSNFHYWVRPMIDDLPTDYGAPTWSSRMNTDFRRAADRTRSAIKYQAAHIKRLFRLFSEFFRSTAR
jgi:Glycosyltransferase sugar-binding region containing DXD motif